MDDTPTQQVVAAEVLGTFVLVLFGCGSVVVWSETAGDGGLAATTTTVGLTFGLALMVMIYAVGRISGAHFNPAVSVGAALGGRLPWHQVPVYVAAQLAGAILGAAVLFGLMQGFDGFSAEGNLGQNGYGDESAGGYALWAALLLELVLTMIFVWVILAVTDERNEHPALAPLAIGFTLAAIHFVAIPATGTSVNPARSIGPAIFAGTDAIVQVWVFVVGPLLGGAIAGATYAGCSARPASRPPPSRRRSQWERSRATAPPTSTSSSGTRVLQPSRSSSGASRSGRRSRSPRGRPSKACLDTPPSSGRRSRSRRGRPSRRPAGSPQTPAPSWPDPGDDDGDERTQVRPPR